MTKVTTIVLQWALLAVLLTAGGFETPGGAIISALDFENNAFWSTAITVGAGVTVILTAFFLRNQSPFTLGAIIIIGGFLSLPLSVVNSVTMPVLVRFLVLGYWLMTLISALGSALRGEF